MTTAQIVVTILIIAAATALTRALPFLIFPAARSTPPYVNYLGAVLPCATIAMLVVYCLRNTAPAEWPHGLPELISIAAVALLQIRARNMLLSIACGLALYMILIRTVFIAV